MNDYVQELGRAAHALGKVGVWDHQVMLHVTTKGMLLVSACGSLSGALAALRSSPLPFAAMPIMPPMFCH